MRHTCELGERWENDLASDGDSERWVCRMVLSIRLPLHSFASGYDGPIDLQLRMRSCSLSRFSARDRVMLCTCRP